MNWLQQNWLVVIFLGTVVIFLLKGVLMAKYYGVREVGVHDLARRLGSPQPPLLVDVRTTAEHNQGHIQQALLIPLAELAKRAPKLLEEHPDREVAVICRTGNRSLFGAIAMRRAGFGTVYNVNGGMLVWTHNGYPVKH